MRLYALKLSQPTVFALTFLLLIVMNLEQVRCSEETIFLYHKISGNLLTMHNNGSVSTVSESVGPKLHQCMVLNTVEPPKEGEPLKMSIYNPSTRRYLCFTMKGKLVGRRECRKNCHFYESVNEAKYIEYKQANPNRRRHHIVAFSVDGKPQKKLNKKKSNAQFVRMNPNGECADPTLNETHVPLRHNKNNKHRKKHKPMV